MARSDRPAQDERVVDGPVTRDDRYRDDRYMESRHLRDDQYADADPARWFSGINVLLGIWLVVAPWVLNYSEQNNAVWNQVVVGIAIAVLALIRAVAPYTAPGLSWVNLVLGVWLVVAPFVLVYDETFNVETIYWNDILVGIAVIVLAAVSAVITQRAHRENERKRTVDVR